MVETDWREILTLSQKELTLSDKEKLCESLCWMEADDIELNFTDLKTLFRLAQDILKLKSEQVHNLVGQIKSIQKKSGKMKVETYTVSPTQSNDSALETITHQEEIIKANKEILEQLYTDIADLESRKSKLEESRSNYDIDSESSRDALSEMNAVVELERELIMKNKHIRKLLGDVKILEDENTKLKDKVSVLKDKLTEATQLIDNLTEQMLSINHECSRLKEILGKSEQTKAEQSIEIEGLRKELFEKDSNRENIYEEIKSKIQHWKTIAKTKKAEVEALNSVHTKLKEDFMQLSISQSLPVENNDKEKVKIKELQDKLLEASKEMEHSADIINLLRAENKQLKSVIEEVPDYSVSDVRNQSDDGKQRIIINKLRKRIKLLTTNLQSAEQLVGEREKELTEITSQLKLLRTDEGIQTLLDSLKSKKQQLKFKNDDIKTLVKEANTLNELINDLQLENETLRQKCNVQPEEKISTKGIIKDYHDLQEKYRQIRREQTKVENQLIDVELLNRNLNTKVNHLSIALKELGVTKHKIKEIIDRCDDGVLPDGGSIQRNAMEQRSCPEGETGDHFPSEEQHQEMIRTIEENKGLRQAMQEILDFLKDNSKTSSGILTLQCPSLEKMLSSMEARYSSGWFAPHMTTVMELRAAIGGKDALLTALHEARKETFDVMAQLSKAAKKSTELEQKLNEIENERKVKEVENNKITENSTELFEFGSWMSEKEENNVDFLDSSRMESLIEKKNSLYEQQLKKALEYFQKKFKDLFAKLTAIGIQMSDDRNKWSIQEEQYKAEIQSLQVQLQEESDDSSEHSPGVLPAVSVPNTMSLKRKCTYLEESYKYIRTLNENMKNELLETKKESMMVASEYETQIQKLLLTISNLTDKLRNSISLELFWKQHFAANDITIKYRKLVEHNAKIQMNSTDLLKRLEEDKIYIINRIRMEINHATGNKSKESQIDAKSEPLILQNQLNRVCKELDEKQKNIEELEKIIEQLQKSQEKIIDETMASTSEKELELMKDQLNILTEDNKILNEHCQHVSSQLDIALMQLQDYQHKQLSNDMEINMLQHQILDLQSSSDNKAIIARLGSEILVAHLQASESHKKIERLNAVLNKEKDLRLEAEEMLIARQKVFDVYALRYESKFKYIYEVMQTLRHQYQGSMPLTSIENYLNKIEELYRKKHDVDEKLSEIEDLRINLISKHSIYDQILDVSKDKCLMNEDCCTHKLQLIMNQSMSTRELEHINKKINVIYQTREDLIKQCNYLEKTLVLVTQGFEKSTENTGFPKYNKTEDTNQLHLLDVQSDDDSSTRKSGTFTIPNPKVSQVPTAIINDQEDKLQNVEKPLTDKSQKPSLNEMKDKALQTICFEIEKLHKSAQTEKIIEESNSLKTNIVILKRDLDKKGKQFSEAIALAQKRTAEVIACNLEKNDLESFIQKLQESINQKDELNNKLQRSMEELNIDYNHFKKMQMLHENQIKNNANEENKQLLLAIKQFENEKNTVTLEYKELLNNEREEYAKSVRELHVKIMELQSKLDRRGSEISSSSGEALKDVISKYTVKIAEYEDKCFKLQNEVDECKSALSTYQSEADRWKQLASERLTKMEQLNSQLEERHCHEVKSYKDENQHWLSQLNEMQREHMDLRNRLTDQKTIYIKQLADKDAQIEQFRVVINNLKTQIMNMQTLISVNDPSFDLSAIVEVDESCDIMSPQGCDRLELKFDSTIDLHDSQEDIVRIPASSTSIWQEPVIERLRREKQLAGKQNAILRRQIKVLAARERRARLDAQNLKNQVFRISTTGNKVTTAETAALHNKIASLQAQLTSARRDTHSSIALWDKWKRSQQAADRWQSRYEEKNQEVTKVVASLHLAKSAVSRLEREKRVLISRLNEVKSENMLTASEKQESESQEKGRLSTRECVCMGISALPVSTQSLLDRVEAQQRRITVLEVAEKGNELLVAEYEKSLAEITSLKGQVLKLESTLLESQIRTPIQQSSENQPELDYWKSYCEMLKDENVQLTHKINTMETLPASTQQHRVNDLEQTVLTLRGIINKLQSEQKSTGVYYKRSDSRPNSSRSSTDKGRTQLESHRIEIANLKRTIHDKDLLLERSKEMLKIAAEREDELLRENAFLRRQLEDMTRPKEGFLSA